MCPSSPCGDQPRDHARGDRQTAFRQPGEIVIGEPIRLSELCSTANPDAAELDRLTAILRDKVIELRGMAQEA